MAFPYGFEETFELGTLGDFDTESDTGSKLDYPHYSTLVNVKDAPMPFRGAYCARIILGDTNDHTLTEGSIDIADAGTGYVRFYMYVSPDFTATADDVFNIFEFQQAGGTIEMSLSMQITAATNLLEIGFGDGTVASSFVTYHYRGEWVCVELLATVSTTGSGVATLFIDGTQVQTTTSLTQAAAVGQGVLGTQNTLSTTTGTIYFDQFVFDDTRIGLIPIRYPESVLLTKSGHVFVGAGELDNVTLLSGAASDNVLTIFDTDVAGTTHGFNAKLELKNVAGGDPVDPAGVPVNVQRGCFVQLTGTNPRAMVNIKHAQGYWSTGRIKQHAAKRIPAPGNW